MKLISNPMRFGTSTFNFHHRALLASKIELNARGYTSVEGFTIDAVQPTGTDIRIIFRISSQPSFYGYSTLDPLYKFENGSLVEYNELGDLDDVLENGNTVEELLALSDIPQFVGKRIFPIIALFAEVDAPVMPKIKLALKVRKNTESYTLEKDSGEIELPVGNDGGTPRIISIEKFATCTGDATTQVLVSTKNADGTWSDYVDAEEVVEQDATAIKFQYKYNVTTINGVDSAKVDKMVYTYTTGAAAVSGSDADLYTVVNNYENDLQTCYLVVKHVPLVDSTIQAYVNFMSEPKHRELITIGTSNGAVQQLALGVNNVKDTGIDPSSIRLFADGQPLFDFDYNVEVSEVTINLASGKPITASYDYGHDSETWLEMEKVIDSQPYLDDGAYMSRFHYTLPDNQTANKKISNVRIQLSRPSGKVTNQSLGKATGKTQMIVLPHRAVESSISINANKSYDPESQILTYVGTKNTNITLSYNWEGEQAALIGFVVGWTASV